MVVTKSDDKDSSIILIFREVAVGVSHYEGFCEHHFGAVGRLQALPYSCVKG